MSIQRKQKQSQVDKPQSAMLEHKSIGLTETNQEEIHNHMYEQVTLTPQLAQLDQHTEPPKTMDNPNYDVNNTQLKSMDNPNYDNTQQKVCKVPDISNPVYSSIAATSEPSKSMDNPNYNNTEQNSVKARQLSDVSNPVYSAISDTLASGDPEP